MAKIISIINFKGGVGKTTITLNLGTALAKYHSKKVLIIDLDPQTNLSLSLLSFKEWKETVDAQGSVKDLFEAYINRNMTYSLKSAIIKQPIRKEGIITVSNLDLLPSHLSMLLIDLQLAKSFVIMGEYENKWQETWDHRTILQKGLNEIKNEYDLILIDCPPNFNIVTQNSIFTSESCIIPTIPDYLSSLGMKIIDGLIKEIDTLGAKVSELVQKDYTRTEMLGILFTRVKAGSSGPVQLHSNMIEQINKMYPQKTFSNYISDSIAIPESSRECLPIFEYKNQKASRSKKQFKELSNEVIERLYDN